MNPKYFYEMSMNCNHKDTVSETSKGRGQCFMCWRYGKLTKQGFRPDRVYSTKKWQHQFRKNCGIETKKPRS